MSVKTFIAPTLSFVMRGLVPRIPLIETQRPPKRDGRESAFGRPGHDEWSIWV
jgi:hypothetical protein